MSRPRAINCYETLGIAPNATLKDINSAYKKLALKHHPDKAKGEGDSSDEFQKIQEAVEILRDPHRRRQHDFDLQISRNIYTQQRFFPQQQAPRSQHSFFSPATAFGGSSGYSGWTPYDFSFNLRDVSSRYMYSYANSVHMNPNSKDSIEERLRCEHERRINEEIRQRNSAGVSASAYEQRPREMTREEAMHARVMRDEEELKKESRQEDDDLQNQQPYVSESSGYGDGEDDIDEEELFALEDEYNEKGLFDFDDDQDGQENQDDQEDQVYQGDQEYEDDQEYQGDENDGMSMFEDELDEDGIYSTGVSVGQSATEYETADQESFDYSDSEDEGDYMSRLRQSVEESADESGTDDEDLIFFDCDEPEPPKLSSDESNDNADSDDSDDNVVSYHNYYNDDANADNNDNEDSDAKDPEDYDFNNTTSDDIDDEDSENEIDDSHATSNEIDDDVSENIQSEPVCQTDPITAFFQAKLNDPSRRYTTDDLRAELQGIMMEIFCGWLESVRLKFPNAKPLTTGNDPDSCPHLGYWVKTYGCPECDVCHGWKPIYTLTCPSCGIKACVLCKFNYEKSEN
ncbi:hypothetical protein ASPWEDRAFT_181100 [Aspergillus wentii DTO 134E9]|uniref:J domain-containing protein n=1 Tax=Aspergillus wentii DTO 134E9 TaxID=1073089 RepID=A0A1L9RXW1_ASPWE|nr:uncharacterized protein ASPWEDRAFT_181100 [Aspergillus wentii DTO 134E9]OJJ39733.1 hypothetical protein ASPWEDRAFT_181100 [Aspergillus wentii DTO 134E9]